MLSIVSWTGPTGGLWSTAADWSTGVVPSAGTDVVIAKSGVVQVNLSGSASVNSISITGNTLNVSGGTLSVAANSSIGAASTLTLNNAILQLGAGTTLTNSGSIAVNSGGQITGSGMYAATSTGLMTLASGTTGTNLLSNSGFESSSVGTNTTTSPSGWGSWGSTYLSSAFAHGGAQSLTESGTSGGANQTLAVTAGTTYTASVYGLNPTTAPLTGTQGGFMDVSFMNSSGGQLTGGEYVTLLTAATATGSWVNSTTTVTAPTGAVSVYFALQVGSVYGATGTPGGSLYFDDVSFGTPTVISGKVSVTSATNSGTITVGIDGQLNDGGAYTQNVGGNLTLLSATVGSGVGNNLVQNPGFESPSAGTSTTTGPNNWGTWGNTYVSSTYNHSGGQSLMQYGSSGASQSFGVAAGVSYTLSVYALDPANSPLTGNQGGFVNIGFNNASGGSLSGGQFVTMVSDTSTVGSWVNYTSVFTAPAGAATFNMDVQVGANVYGQTGTAGGSVYWDDVAFGATALNSATVSAVSVSNAGTITVGSGDTVSASGNFVQAATGIFNSDLGGVSLGYQYGSIVAGGAATLAGTLQATLVNGYAPSINDGFSVLSYSSESGSFANYQLPSGSTYAFQSGLNPTYVGISAVPLSLTATINAASTTTTATQNLVGVNLAEWDGYLNTTQTQQMVSAAGLSILRFPGGSASDDYHFNAQNNYFNGSNTVPEFAQFISAVNATGVVTVDYGTGSPQEAEAELAYLDGSTTDTTTIGYGIQWRDATQTVPGAWLNVNWQTVGYWAKLRAASPLKSDDGLNFMRIAHPAAFTNIKYWEMGNEEYGSWEDDQHGIAAPALSGSGNVSTGAQHDPATYATFTAAFESFDAHDSLLPAVVTGIDSSSPDGTGDSNWTRNVVTDLNADGYAPGFISDHNYVQNAGGENDSQLLNSTVSGSNTLGWVTRHTDYESTLTSILGSTKAASVQFLATEYNSNAGTEGKQMTSLVNGLFAADSIGSLLNAGYVGGLVWDLRNGWTTDGNNSPSLYGWRQGGDEGLLGAGTNAPPSTGAYIAYPTYYGQQLASKIMQTGGLDVSTVTSYSVLTIYSVLEPNGHLDLMVINKNPDAQLGEQFNLSGFTPSGAAQLWQYGEAQDYAQSISTTGASALANFGANLSLNGSNFSYSFPAYSMTVIDLTPKLTVATAASAVTNPGIVGTAVTLAAAGLENGSGTALTYSWAATGPGTVTYTGSTNGSYAARTILANFSVPGNYQFTVTITDPGGQTITSSAQDLILPLFATETGSALTINLNNFAPINVTSSGNTTTVTEDGYALSFPNVASVLVNGSATNNVLNFSGSLAAPFTFTTGSTTTLNVQSGIVNIAAGSGSNINVQLFSAVNILAGAGVVLAQASSETARTLLQTSSLTLAGSIEDWTAKLDLNGNDLEVTNGNFANIIDQLTEGYNAAGGGYWQGSEGIISSAAASDTTYLSTLGMILNTVDGTATATPLYTSGNLFDGTAPPATAVLVKYTFYGDADLSGIVDGTDYSRIDNGSLAGSTEWYNGDFNYDGVIDGSDYTLIDNAFNSQTASITSEIAGASAKVRSSPRRTALPTVPLNALPASTVFGRGVFGQGPAITASSLPWVDRVLKDLTLI